AELKEEVGGHAGAAAVRAGADVIVAARLVERAGAQRAGARVLENAALERTAPREASVELGEQGDTAADRSLWQVGAGAGAHAVGETDAVLFAHALALARDAGELRGVVMGVAAGDRAVLAGVAHARAVRGQARSDLGIAGVRAAESGRARPRCVGGIAEAAVGSDAVVVRGALGGRARF